MDIWEYSNKSRKVENKKKIKEDEVEVDYRVNGCVKEGNTSSEDNHIYFYSEVTKKTVYELNREIRHVTQKMLDIEKKYNIEAPPIYLHINSYGGSIFAAMSTVDIIKYNKVPIYSIVEGCAASAATLMSVVAEKRYIRPNSYMLIHQLSTIFWGKMEEFDDEMKNLNKLMDMIKTIYKEHTTIPVRKLNDILKHDLWWDSSKCIENNLVDEIIREI